MHRSLHADLRRIVLDAIDEGLFCGRQAAERVGTARLLQSDGLQRVAQKDARPAQQGAAQQSHGKKAHAGLNAATLDEMLAMTLHESKERLTRQAAWPG